jgi:hypothetical protein
MCFVNLAGPGVTKLRLRRASNESGAGHWWSGLIGRIMAFSGAEAAHLLAG